MKETGEIEVNPEDECVVSGWLFKLGVKSSTIIWTKEVMDLINKKLEEIPDIEFILVETAPTELLDLLGAKKDE